MMQNLEGLTRSERFYYEMMLVRRFEERLFDLFDRGELVGTTHGYIGQEANAVAVINNLAEDDIIVSNHRCHGHYLVRTGDAVGLLGELMGKRDGVCGGRGGSQHLCKDNFYTNGVLGSTIPVAAGMAYAEKQKRTGAIAVLFTSDGAFGEGTMYETFNIISLWKVPLLVVVENNGYAQTTPLHLNFAGSFKARAQAFDLSASEIESTDVEQLYERFHRIVPTVREQCLPHVEVIHTYRLCGHSKGDDYRPADEIQAWQARDPLKVQGERLDPATRSELAQLAEEQVAQAEAAAREMPFPELDSHLVAEPSAQGAR